MKLNEKLVIYGTRVILVPYDKEHVEKYHGWMQNKDILEATASEPLSIENEYKMQESWRNDEDKLTFIVLSAQDIEDGHGELDAMIGDVNLFLNDPEDDCCGEVEVMIAESRARQKGCATEALKLLMGYCYDKIKVSKFIAKIGKHNLKSYSLFKNKLKFRYESESEIFEEFTMELVIDEKGRKVLNVPFLELERNDSWNGPGEMPYLKPAEEFVKPADVVEVEKVKQEAEENAVDKMYLCTESASEDEDGKDNDAPPVDEEPVMGSNAAAWGSVGQGDGDGANPQPKKQKLHFGGLNMKKKKPVTTPAVDFSAAPDEFDEW